jgi:AmiR/NasT family two-component response regulator
MEGRKVSQDEAFALLRSASQRANRPLREIASAIVQGANLLR